MRLVKQKAKEGLQVSLNWTSGGSSWICNKKWKNVIKMVGSGTVQCRQQRRVWRIGLYTWYHLRNHQHQTQTPSGQQLTRELLGLPNDWLQNSTLSQHHRSSKFLMRSCEQKSWKDPSNPNDRRGDSDCETSIDCKEEWWVFFFLEVKRSLGHVVVLVVLTPRTVVALWLLGSIYFSTLNESRVGTSPNRSQFRPRRFRVGWWYKMIAMSDWRVRCTNG